MNAQANLSSFWMRNSLHALIPKPGNDATDNYKGVFSFDFTSFQLQRVALLPELIPSTNRNEICKNPIHH